MKTRREKRALIAGHSKMRRDLARAAGLCTTCTNEPAEPGLCRCVTCNVRHRKPVQSGEVLA